MASRCGGSSATLLIEDLLDKAWILLIRIMAPVGIRALAQGRSLTDEQVAAIARRAGARVAEAARRDMAQVKHS